MSVGNLFDDNEYTIYCRNLNVEAAIEASQLSSDLITSVTLPNSNIVLEPQGTGKVGFANNTANTALFDVSALSTDRTITIPDSNVNLTNIPTALSSGTFVPTLTVTGGGAWNLTGATGTCAYLRVDNIVMYTAVISLPNGTSLTTANLILNITNLPFAQISAFGTSNANVNSVAATNPAYGNGDVHSIGANSVQLGITYDPGIARVGTSANPHTVSASFMSVL